MRLAEYVAKRRQVLDMLRAHLRKDEHGEYILEEALHNLICPMRDFYTHHDYSKHNLWILDDLLAFYQFFSSDKTLSSLTAESKSTKEPDLLFFNPAGFRRPGTDEAVVIVEFKRPGDKRPSSDPTQQVLKYIEELREKTVVDVDGETITNINDKTPFHAIIVMNISVEAKRELRRSVASTELPGGKGFYGYAPNHNALIQVMDFQRMLYDAEARNMVFFSHLGLQPQRYNPSVQPDLTFAPAAQNASSASVGEVSSNAAD